MIDVKKRLESLVEEIAKAEPNNGAYKKSAEELNLLAARAIKEIALELEEVFRQRWMHTMK